MTPIVERTLYFYGLKTFSVNASYIRTNHGVTKSSGAREWTAQFFNLLASTENQEKIQELKSAFSPAKHIYHIEIIVNSPDYFTAKGEISNRCHDVTNYEKILIDSLMLPKFNEEPFPYGAPNLNIDDRYLKRLVSETVPNKHRSIEVKIAIKPRPLLP